MNREERRSQWLDVLGAAAIARHVLASARPGSIVLAHANGRGYHTAAALEILLPRLRAASCELVTVGELMAMGRPEIVQSCYDRQARRHRPVR